MKFKMNDRTWEIKEISQEEIRQHIIDYKYDGVPVETGSSLKYNPGNGTVMGHDWSTSVRFAVSIGFSLYY